MSRISSLGTTPPTDVNNGPRDIKDLDLNEFLKLMVTELTNQDPLNPMDNTELVQQMGQLRSIAASDQLSSTLAGIQTSQSLTTASSLLGKKVTALSAEGQNITGVVDRVSVEVDAENNDKRAYRVHIGNQSVELANVREVKG
jgi:flagellar basal-body rod modification protein FlgD